MRTKSKATYFNRLTMAITFAEAGEFETAKDMLKPANRKQRRPETRVEQRPILKF